ncbi:hypothetical protein GE09DRAFT_1150292 [Coniochaeta sp. 2T2.1]|nr:hypothetical protein GE09DRAFT_1150292 [Coniochaeta sp. 2T2.1]
MWEGFSSLWLARVLVVANKGEEHCSTQQRRDLRTVEVVVRGTLSKCLGGRSQLFSKSDCGSGTRKSRLCLSHVYQGKRDPRTMTGGWGCGISPSSCR